MRTRLLSWNRTIQMQIQKCDTDSRICLVQGMNASFPKKDPAQRIATLVQSVILLKEALAAMPGLAKTLEPAQSELLKAVSTFHSTDPAGMGPYRLLQDAMIARPVCVQGVKRNQLHCLQQCPASGSAMSGRKLQQQKPLSDACCNSPGLMTRQCLACTGQAAQRTWSLHGCWLT